MREDAGDGWVLLEDFTYSLARLSIVGGLAPE